MKDPTPLQQWFALHVRSRHEKSVHAQLESRQYDAFLPLYQSKHRWADRWKTVSLPLFPGYVFCRFDVSSQHKVVATSGVIDVVRVGQQAAPVESSEIEAIARVAHSSVVAEPYPDLVPGERIVLNGGPLSGLAGAVVESRHGLRLVVSVELLRRSVLVEIERNWVVSDARSKPEYKLVPESVFVLRAGKNELWSQEI